MVSHEEVPNLESALTVRFMLDANDPGMTPEGDEFYRVNFRKSDITLAPLLMLTFIGSSSGLPQREWAPAAARLLAVARHLTVFRKVYGCAPSGVDTASTIKESTLAIGAVSVAQDADMFSDWGETQSQVFSSRVIQHYPHALNAVNSFAAHFGGLDLSISDGLWQTAAERISQAEPMAASDLTPLRAALGQVERLVAGAREIIPANNVLH